MDETLKACFAATHASAVRKVEVLLATQYDYVKSGSLDQNIEFRITNPGPTIDWITVRLLSDFPLTPPKFFASADYFGKVPHVNESGVVCVWDDATTRIDHNSPAEIVEVGIEKALEILKGSQEGELRTAIDEEQFSYFGSRGKFLSLLREFTSDTLVDVVWLEKNGTYTFIAAHSREEALTWISNSRLGVPTVFGTRPLFALSEPLLPPSPTTNQEFLSRAPSFLGQKSYTLWAKSHAEAVHPLFLGFRVTPRGVVQAAWMHSRIGFRQKNGRFLTVGCRDGFRPGKVPVEIEYRQWSAAGSVEWYEGEDATRERLIKRTSGLTDAVPLDTLTCVGLGALGSQICHRVCSDHPVNAVSLVDPEKVSLGNVPRHLADFEDVGKLKVDVARAKMLRKSPWMSVQSIPKRGLQACMDDPSLLESQVVLLATGDQAFEEFVVSWFCENGPRDSRLFRVWAGPNLEQGDLVMYRPNSPLPDLSRCTPASAPKAAQYEPGCSPGFLNFGGSRLSCFISWASRLILEEQGQAKAFHWRTGSHEE